MDSDLQQHRVASGLTGGPLGDFPLCSRKSSAFLGVRVKDMAGTSRGVEQAGMVAEGLCKQGQLQAPCRQ